MTEKTEEQMAKERAAVDSMRNARSNMDTALQRIMTLETALRDTISHLGAVKTYIGPNAHMYPSDNRPKTCHSYIEDAIAAAQRKLG